MADIDLPDNIDPETANLVSQASPAQQLITAQALSSMSPDTWSSLSPTEQQAAVGPSRGSILGAGATGTLVPAPYVPPSSAPTNPPNLVEPQFVQSIRNLPSTVENAIMPYWNAVRGTPQSSAAQAPASSEAAPNMSRKPYFISGADTTGDTERINNPTTYTPGTPAHESPIIAPKRQAQYEADVDKLQQSLAGEMGAASTVGQTQAWERESAARGEAQEANEHARNEERQRAIEANYRNMFGDQYQAARAMDDMHRRENVDPQRLWSNANTGQKILWTLSNFLGGFAGKQSGYDKLIERDIEAQKTNFEQHGRDVDNMYSRAFRLTGNADEAEKLANSYAQLKAAHMGLGLAQASGSATAIAKASEHVAQLEQRLHEQTIAKDEKLMGFNRYMPATGATISDYAHEPETVKLASQIYTDAAKNGQAITPEEAVKNAIGVRHSFTQPRGYAPINKLTSANTGKISSRIVNTVTSLEEASRLLKEANTIPTGDVNRGKGAGIALRTALENGGFSKEEAESIGANAGWDLTRMPIAARNALASSIDRRAAAIRQSAAPENSSPDSSFVPSQ